MDPQDIAKLWQGWTPPEGLNRSTPRPVTLKVAGIALIAVSVLMAVGGIAAAALLSGQERRQEAFARRMQAEGRDTQGVVTRRWRTGEYNDQHRVSYRFSVDGREYSGRATISSRRWNRLDAESPIAVRYLASEPARNYPSADPPRPLPVWFPYLMAALLFIPGALLPMMVRRQRRLLEEGRPAPAVVTRNRRVYTKEGGSQNIVYYQFALLGGGTCKGRSNRKPMPQGSVICVLYDPDNPRRNGAYPMSLVKLVP